MGVFHYCCFDCSSFFFFHTHIVTSAVRCMLAVQNERDRISSRRNIPDSQDLPPITILAQAETLSKQVKISLLESSTDMFEYKLLFAKAQQKLLMCDPGNPYFWSPSRSLPQLECQTYLSRSQPRLEMSVTL